MDDLRAYLKDLTPDEQAKYCVRAGTTINYVRKVLNVADLRFGPEVCAALERESNGSVSRRNLRPTDWHLIWPELVTSEHPIPDKKAA